MNRLVSKDSNLCDGPYFNCQIKLYDLISTVHSSL